MGKKEAAACYVPGLILIWPGLILLCVRMLNPSGGSKFKFSEGPLTTAVRMHYVAPRSTSSQRRHWHWHWHWTLELAAAFKQYLGSLLCWIKMAT
eukprot:1157024-Pelagomonas_calceolata.AAC.2